MFPVILYHKLLIIFQILLKFQEIQIAIVPIDGS